jgi:multidrug efflux pump subunit AcrA (membrane-fusion protein)
MDAYAAALAARDQASQQLALAQNQLRYNTLVADHDGTITSEQAEVGQVVAAGQAVFGFAWSGERDVFIACRRIAAGGGRGGTGRDASACWRCRARATRRTCATSPRPPIRRRAPIASSWHWMATGSSCPSA